MGFDRKAKHGAEKNQNVNVPLIVQICLNLILNFPILTTNFAK